MAFREKDGQRLTCSQSDIDQDTVFKTRVKDAFNSAGGKPFAMENLNKARRWLLFHGLDICEATANSEPTLSQQIVQCLRPAEDNKDNKNAHHAFHLKLPNGRLFTPKRLLLLITIARLYTIKIVVFSTRKKPLEIVPDAEKECKWTVAILSHQDSVLSVGQWYPLGLAVGWAKQPASVRKATDELMDSPPAIKRTEGTAPKRKNAVSYKSIGIDTLKNALRIVM